MGKNIYIHLGLHKCASTFLQLNVFSACPDAYYIKRQTPYEIAFFEALYKGQKESVLKNWHKIIQQTTCDKIILSNESLFGSPSKGWKDGTDRLKILRELGDDLKFLLIIRRQDNFAASYYSQYIHEGGTLPYDQFIVMAPPEQLDDDKLYVHDMDWVKLISRAQKILGDESLTVLPFELLMRDQKRFIEAVFRFLDSPAFAISNIVPNRSYSRVSFRIAKSLNQFLRSQRNPDGIIPQQPFLNFFMRRRKDSILFRLLSSISYRTTLRFLLQNIFDRLFPYKKATPLPKKIKKEIMDLHREKNKKLSAFADYKIEELGW